MTTEPEERQHRAHHRGLTLGASAALLVAVFWLFRIVLRGDQPPGYFDILNYYYPSYRATFGWLAEGRLPLWNPFQLCGVPWLPALQIGAFYPPHLAYLWLPTGPAMGLMSLLHFTAVAVAWVLLARALGLRVESALLCAALFTMRGLFTQQSVVPNVLETSVWTVPGALAVHRLARQPGPRSAALLALCTGASLLAGYPQFSVYSVYTWAALLAAYLMGDRRPLRAWLRAGCGFAAAITLGALLASVQLLPTLQQSAEATRGLSGGLSVPQMNPWGFAVSLEEALGRLFSSNRSDLALSLGYVGLLLLPFAFVARRHRPLAWILAGLGVLSMLISLGPVTPLFDFYLLLPPMKSFRNPARILVVRDFCFALLAGLGLHGVRCLAARFVPGRPALPRGLTVGLLCLALFELFQADSARPKLPYFDEPRVERYQRAHPVYAEIASSEDRVLFWSPQPYPPLPPKLGTLFQMKSVDDYEPLALSRQALYFGYLARGTTAPEWPPRSPFFGRFQIPFQQAKAEEMASRHRLLDLAAVRFVLSERPIPLPLQRYAELTSLQRTPGRRGDPAVSLLRNPSALPRAFVTHRIARAPDPEPLLARLSSPDFDPLAMSYVESDAAPMRPQGGPRGRRARILRDEPTLVEIEAELPAPGLVVLADSYYPDWHASIDGEAAPILPTNLLFRGVRAAAGKHRVRFEYRPRPLVLGAAMSLLATALLVGLGTCGQSKIAR